MNKLNYGYDSVIRSVSSGFFFVTVLYYGLLVFPALNYIGLFVLLAVYLICGCISGFLIIESRISKMLINLAFSAVSSFAAYRLYINADFLSRNYNRLYGISESAPGDGMAALLYLGSESAAFLIVCIIGAVNAFAKTEDNRKENPDAGKIQTVISIIILMISLILMVNQNVPGIT